MLEPVDKHSGIPAYLQIMDMIKKEIVLGNLKFGDQLPPVRELKKVFGVNVNTIMKSLEKLQMDGIVEAQHGVGYFVKKSKIINPKVVDILEKSVEELKKMDMDLNTTILILEEVWKKGEQS